MAIKRKGVLARPGEYRYGDKTEIKVPEELRAAAERQPIVVLTRGHPKNGIPTASQYLGTVTQKWNEKKQLVEGEFWFYEEYVPQHIRDKIVNGEPVPISAGFTLESVDENGIQRGILYSHIAVLDGENPVCPLGECGVNVRAESEGIIMRYEQESELAPPEEPKAQEDPIAVLKAEIAELKEMLKSLATQEPAGKEPVEKEEKQEQQAEPEPEPEETPEPEKAEEPSPPKVEPEKVVPKSPPPKAERTVWDDGEVATGALILGKRPDK